MIIKQLARLKCECLCHRGASVVHHVNIDGKDIRTWGNQCTCGIKSRPVAIVKRRFNEERNQ